MWALDLNDRAPASNCSTPLCHIRPHQELYTYTGKHLMRVYPAGWRITSGNYNPMTAWIRGASFAALNWQVWDKPLWCNAGKVRQAMRQGQWGEMVVVM